jgi:anti-sigma B factor antagonist
MDGSGCGWAEAPGFRAEANRNGNNGATVQLHGELDIASAGAAWRALEQLDADIQQIVLDVSHITFCDAAGVRFLLTAQEHARATGRNLAVRHPSRSVRRVLALTGELRAICPADPSADEEPEQADLRHLVTICLIGGAADPAVISRSITGSQGSRSAYRPPSAMTVGAADSNTHR